MTNIIGYEVVYSDDEDNQSIYLAYEEESSSESDITSKEEKEYKREAYIIKVKIGKKTLQKKQCLLIVLTPDQLSVAIANVMKQIDS
jgi:hypothetical protein